MSSIENVEHSLNISNEIIMIFGGSGSLGNELISDLLDTNIIINYSRDENKHWSMDLKYKSTKLRHIIGDIRDSDKVRSSIIRVNPTIIIIAAALKHIDRCEFESHECISTNLIGIQNILNTIELYKNTLNLKSVCFISTDKACSPINTYGLCKALCENMMVEKAKFVSNIKFVIVRYGNVLNSRGSIIPIIQTKCMDESVKSLTLTHEKMTRFIMTLSDSIKLIKYALVYGNSGDIVIPKLNAMYIKDVLELFAEKYNKTINITGIRPGEKLYESLINDSQSYRTIQVDNYYIIKPSFTQNLWNESYDYNSSQNVLSKSELYDYLHLNNYI